MGSVIYQDLSDVRPMRLKRHRWTVRHTKIAILLFYALAVPTYIAIGLQPSHTSMAETLAEESQNASGYLIINSINLSTPVSEVQLHDHTLVAPEYIAGSYSSHKHKTLLIGHSSTVFERLKDAKLSDIVDFNEHSYRIVNIETRPKDNISMTNILAAAEHDTIVLMTCTGKNVGANDYSHRLIVTAEAI